MWIDILVTEDVRSTVTHGKIWVAAADLADYLGYKSVQGCLHTASKKNVQTRTVDGKTQKCVNLEGVEEIVTRSDKPKCRTLRKVHGIEKPEDKRGQSPATQKNILEHNERRKDKIRPKGETWIVGGGGGTVIR